MIILTRLIQIQSTTVVCGKTDDIVDIDEDLQEALIKEREIECLTKQINEQENFNCIYY